MALNTIMVAKCAGYAQAARRLLVKKNRHRLTCRDAICPKLRANCALDKQTAHKLHVNCAFKNHTEII